MKHRLSPLDWLLEAVALAAILITIAWPAAHWSELPDRVPRHYNASGDVDRWGSKSAMWLLPAIGAAAYVLLSLLERVPQIYNVPFAVDREQPEVRAILVRVVRAAKAGVLAIFAYITWTGVRVALGQEQGLGSWFLPAVLLIALVPPMLFLGRLRRYRL